ncbi:polysaccharide deacetylase family protein [Ferruginibacter sp. HRS2-29]|uniref:polysaccharide deacetylase family protein n=1 Tax=Ferruginibacter sp. HRS2-29 TaxID=2487334 RepID=UPI0020CCCC7C|nr:polysaccharide deacetylase family protein [Ferruginibacter sp. HRS2-29]MCP9752687.1 hypothetical protein [Ferruginibacter sp. HRS2-29]
MLLIYSAVTSYRLQYICQFIFKEQLGITYSLTLDADGFAAHDGPKVNYSKAIFANNGFAIRNTGLLFETGVKAQAIECFEANGNKAFFKIEDSDFPFDIFAASFYLLSRYEEYLPHTKDMYGRYAHENSLAFKEGFLNKPLVNFWIQDFAKALHTKFPAISFQFPEFSFTPTYDIDIAYSYRNKGLLRNLGGFIKSPSMERVNVLLRLKKDPYDAYDFLDNLHRSYGLQPVYFFLVATSQGEYDKNLSPYAYAMWQLMRQHAKKYRVGIHPSWRSFEKPELIKKEKRIVETAGKMEVNLSRQHYIKLALPDTFRHLLDAGITHEHSMGYGSINGFRASVASSFNWYDLDAEQVTRLRLHPFCFMDANSFFEQKQQAAESYDELQYYYDACKAANGRLITIFHNNFLGTSRQFDGWREMYQRFITQLPR